MNTVFKYVTRDGRELGYHLSTFCQVGPKEKAKQYNCDTPESVEAQRQTILENVKHVLDATNTTSMFAGVHADTRERCFPGLTFEDVELVAEQTDLSEPFYAYTIINE
jgi:hypothetical protein